MTSSQHLDPALERSLIADAESNKSEDIHLQLRENDFYQAELEDHYAQLYNWYIKCFRIAARRVASIISGRCDVSMCMSR